jgi:very-short-patch-repair endonuclease
MILAKLSHRKSKRGDHSTLRQPVQSLQRAFARKMRADATKAENLLWQAVRNKQLEGLKFKRQVPLDGYILDFVCFEARLIVEVDGSQHSGSVRDVVRDRHFEDQGFRTIRFWNDEIERNIDGVCLTILHEVKARSGK